MGEARGIVGGVGVERGELVGEGLSWWRGKLVVGLFFRTGARVAAQGGHVADTGRGGRGRAGRGWVSVEKRRTARHGI